MLSPLRDRARGGQQSQSLAMRQRGVCASRVELSAGSLGRTAETAHAPTFFWTPQSHVFEIVMMAWNLGLAGGGAGTAWGGGGVNVGGRGWCGGGGDGVRGGDSIGVGGPSASRPVVTECSPHRR